MTTTIIDWSDVEAAAREMANNHARFDSFAWWGEPEDGANWTVVYTHNRDSGLIDLSNAAVIEEEMGKFEDVISQRHNHWACGWVDGLVIRVYDDEGAVTDAFRRYCELMNKLEDYPVLDEEDYSRREHEAGLEYIADIGKRWVKDGAPDGWASEVFSWLWENDPGECENRDGTGPAPSDDAIRDALLDLDMLDPDVAEEFYGEDWDLPDVYWSVIGVDHHGDEVRLGSFATEWEADNRADFCQRFETEYVRCDVRRVEK